MSKKANVGLVGVGHLGRIHLAKLMRLENCNLVGFYDIDREKSARVAQESGAYAAQSLDDILEKADIISIVVPTSEHYKVGVRALEAGRHIFMEKPLTETAEQGRELVEMAAAKNLKCGVGHIERFNPAVSAMHDKIGRPVFIEAHRLNPFNPRGLDVAVILELMIHDIDLCLHFTKSQVIDIQASAVQVLSDKMDIANARLAFASGCVANLTASRISPAGMRKIRVFQKDNYLSFDLKEKKVDSYSLLAEDFDNARLKGFATSFTYWETGKKIVYHKPECENYDMLETELRHFISAVAEDLTPPVSGEEGLAALKIALEVESKARQGLAKINTGL